MTPREIAKHVLFEDGRFTANDSICDLIEQAITADRSQLQSEISKLVMAVYDKAWKLAFEKSSFDTSMIYALDEQIRNVFFQSSPVESSRFISELKQDHSDSIMALKNQIAEKIQVAVLAEREACVKMLMNRGAELYKKARENGDSIINHYTERGNQAYLDAGAIQERSRSNPAPEDDDPSILLNCGCVVLHNELHMPCENHKRRDLAPKDQSEEKPETMLEYLLRTREEAKEGTRKERPKYADHLFLPRHRVVKCRRCDLPESQHAKSLPFPGDFDRIPLLQQVIGEQAETIVKLQEENHELLQKVIRGHIDRCACKWCNRLSEIADHRKA